jgi:hypothetical protein
MPSAEDAVSTRETGHPPRTARAGNDLGLREWAVGLFGLAILIGFLFLRQHGGLYVAAVVSWHECTTCSEDDEVPNHARRITPWVRDWISTLRETFP